MNSYLLKTLTFLGGVALVAAIVYVAVGNPKNANAEAPSGLQATVATTSIAGVSTVASTIFATSTCTSRIISTQSSAILLTFSDNQGQVPTGSYGFVQAASTTVSYDSGIYGCGAFKAYSYTPSSLTVSETR